jgi:hypothetical protein
VRHKSNRSGQRITGSRLTSSPLCKCAQPRKIPAQAELGRATLEGKMNAIVPATSRYCVTVNTVALVAIPPGVVIAILPVFAPVGTFAVTCVSEFTATVVALTPPNVTFVV